MSSLHGGGVVSRSPDGRAWTLSGLRRPRHAPVSVPILPTGPVPARILVSKAATERVGIRESWATMTGSNPA